MQMLEPNTIVNIVPYIVPTPVGIDVAVKQLQSSFALIPWVEKSFARAVYMSYTENGSEVIFPGLYVGTGKDYFNALGCDNWRAYSFMVAKDPERVLEYNEGINSVKERGLSCYFWANLQRVDPTRSDDFIEELKKDVLNSIQNTRFRYESGQDEVMGISVTVIEDEPKNVFKSFSIDVTKNQSLYYPYRAFRIDLDVVYQQGC